MSAFTSGKRAELGLPPASHDREPYVDDHGRRESEPYEWDADLSTCPACVTTLDPRPEFDVPENPILAAFRAQDGLASLDYWLNSFECHDTFGGFTSWDRPSNPNHSFTIATPEQIKHARRVLSKLAALS